MSTGDEPPELQPTSPVRRLIRRTWPWAIIALAVTLTAAWICVLVFGAVKIIEIVI
jgi:hypothetical protein